MEVFSRFGDVELLRVADDSTNLNKILTSLPATFLCAQLDIAKRCIVESYYPVNFCSSYGGHAFVGTSAH